MKPTNQLTAEHNAVLVALNILAEIAEAVADKREQALGDLERILDFFTGFVDHCHHAKEEQVLFPELERRGLRREGGPVGVMLAEHGMGRTHLQEMAEALADVRRGDARAATLLRERANAYGDLMRAHIAKENNVLFPMAERIVPKDVAERLAEQFDEIERDRVGEGKHEAYHALLHELADRYVA